MAPTNSPTNGLNFTHRGIGADAAVIVILIVVGLVCFFGCVQYCRNNPVEMPKRKKKKKKNEETGVVGATGVPSFKGKDTEMANFSGDRYANGAIVNGWKRVDDAEAGSYYWHVETGRSEWSDPNPAPGATLTVDKVATAAANADPYAGDAVVNGWKKLPDGQGGFYFWNVSTGESLWNDPNVETRSTSAWQKIDGPDGPYWWNSQTGESLWERPAGA